MVRKRIVALSERIECLLRRKCGAFSPKGRMIVVLTMLALFTVLSLYFSVSSVCRFGQSTDDAIRIRHIEPTVLQLEPTTTDNVKQSNDFNYDDKRETE
ncbi:TraL conjugative transposon family protein [uncultured Alistipes sp.]|uniref:TraL conjugative transposon family protein n=1 Tax=uncultured Alistipes sp. TaxID=538949 RepID=UPI0025B19BD2|nr:TraL conjugative transposon family protein [uncultured Alistipes sp.]